MDKTWGGLTLTETKRFIHVLSLEGQRAANSRPYKVLCLFRLLW